MRVDALHAWVAAYAPLRGWVVFVSRSIAQDGSIRAGSFSKGWWFSFGPPR